MAALPGRRAPASVFRPLGLQEAGGSLASRGGERWLVLPPGVRAPGFGLAAGRGGAHALLSVALGVLSYFLQKNLYSWDPTYGISPPIRSPFLFPCLTFALCFLDYSCFSLASLTFLYFPLPPVLPKAAERSALPRLQPG